MTVLQRRIFPGRPCRSAIEPEQFIAPRQCRRGWGIVPVLAHEQSQGGVFALGLAGVNGSISQVVRCPATRLAGGSSS